MSILSTFRKPEVAKAGNLDAKAADPTPPPLSIHKEIPAGPDDPPRAKLVSAFDATSSRQAAWRTSIPLTVALLEALPGQLDVALAVHGSSQVHTFTSFGSDARKLRDLAAGVICRGGYTRLLDILMRVLHTDGVGTVVYVGDAFEEDHQRARDIAAALAARGTRLIILHDTLSGGVSAADIFAEMAGLTGGAVMPFDASAVAKLRELLTAIAVLAVGGTHLLKAKQETLPAARLLLPHLKD
jgi:hypothetical protein